jgi:hypothetical protein
MTAIKSTPAEHAVPPPSGTVASLHHRLFTVSGIVSLLRNIRTRRVGAPALEETSP